MLPQKTQLLTVVMATTLLLSLGSSFSLMPFNAYASHSYEAGVQGDAIPDNTHIDLSNLTLPQFGVFPLYDSSPNFVSGHFLYKGPCEGEDVQNLDDDGDGILFEPKVQVIAGHIDEVTDNTHVDFVPLYYVGHASPIPGICVYHAHLPDPLEGGSTRITDVDLVNYASETPVEFNPGDAVDINVQRSLGSIGNYYVGDVKLPTDPELVNGNNPVIDLNEGHEEEEETVVADNLNTQNMLDNLDQLISDY
jgi:hypothetical protein